MKMIYISKDGRWVEAKPWVLENGRWRNATPWEVDRMIHEREALREHFLRKPND